MKRFPKSVLVLIAIVFGSWLMFECSARFFAEVLWFKELDYLAAFVIRRQSQIAIWLLVTGISGLFLAFNLWLAGRWKWQWIPHDKWYDAGVPYAPEKKQKLLTSKTSQVKGHQSFVRRYPDVNRYSPRLNLFLILLIGILGSVIIASIFLHNLQVALSVWETSYRLPQISETLKPPLDIFDFGDINGFLMSYLRQLGLVVIIVFLVLWSTTTSLRVISVLVSIVLGFIWAGNWTVVLKFFHPSSFNFIDQQFGQDISFYVFSLPLLQLIESWAISLSSFAFIACTLFYVLSGHSLTEGRFPSFSRPQIRHLSGLAAVVMICLSYKNWLARFDLLYNSTGAVYGAGYTNINIQLPVERYLIVTGIAGAIWLVYKAVVGYQYVYIGKVKIKRFFFLILPFVIYLLIFFFKDFISLAVQSLLVEPNELATEQPYIERNIAMTRQAFDLEKIEVRTFNPEGKLTAQDLQDNHLTVENIRLWDVRPILETNRQLQRIRPYYQFHDADIDRYILSEDSEKTNGDKQQVIISARELDYGKVVDIAKTWVNEHLIYTHGYGFTLSPVTRVAEGGLPYYYIKDIGADSEESGSLTVANQKIKNSIPIGKPRIYYGELTNLHIMTPTQVQEFDYPSGDENVYTIYNGSGGINIGNYFQRVLFAEYLKDWRMLFAQNFTNDTKVLFRRNIRERVREIAPFLNYDRDPYLVAAETDSQADNPNNLYWIIDAYTTSDRYPYSDPGQNAFNYLRNSVKVTVDAYNGKVNFYIADSEDPIIQTWNKIFPELFQPLSAMPTQLHSHIRYPEDLLNIQSERLLTYHMKDPQVFYNREDQWQVPEEIYGKEYRQVKPYYLIMKLPTNTEEEFVLLHLYTPTSRPNLIAWMAARSDNEDYGKLLLYQFPKQKLIYGPNQIEALINQDPVISQQISLWNREGSRAIQGNLLIIPIEQSLLYVEPLYIEAEENSLPALARVIVIYENQIVMAETLEAGIDAIFKSEQDPNAIVRPVEDVTKEER